MRQIYLSLILLPLIVYSSTLFNGFSYDDPLVITLNQYHLNNPQNILKVFTKDYFLISNELSYRPIVTISYFLDQLIGKGDPFQYHLTNLALHIINVLALLNLLMSLTGNKTLSVVSTSIFAIHPSLTEAINGIGFREDLLCTLFVFISIRLYIRGRVILSLISYGIALLAKEMAFPLPILLFVYDLFFRKAMIRNYLFFLTLSFLYVILRFYLFHSPLEGADPNFQAVVGMEKLTTIPMSVFYYTKLLLFPISLSADYIPYLFLTSPPLYFIAMADILLVLFIIYAAKHNYNPVIRFAIAWFLITITPVLNLIKIANPFAERYLYLPSAGFILFISAIFLKKRIIDNRVSRILLITVIGIFMILTSLRNTVWKDDNTLWQDTANKAPLSFRPYMSLASTAFLNQDNEAAIDWYNKIIHEIEPDYHVAHTNLGTIYLNMGNINKAVEELTKAVEHAPSFFVRPLLTLSLVYKKMGKTELAKENYLKAIEMQPHNPHVYLYYGIFLGEQGMTEDAIKEIDTALNIDPDILEAHYYLGLAYEDKKLFRRAMDEFMAELAVNPFYYKARLGIVRGYINYGLNEMARAELKEVLKIAPTDTEAVKYLSSLKKLHEK